ncbi:MAG: hypothetical protein Q7K29_02420 [Thermoleophilia bacterium]|nr:hypothetical protein [Thermoleophilia bacterium]
MVKKPYQAPEIKTLKVQEPLAYACNVYGMSGGQGTWSGPGLFLNPNVTC